MFCKNCGTQIESNEAFCGKCGSPKGEGTAFCASCGEARVEGANVCPYCGVPVNQAAAQPEVKTASPAGHNQKSKLAAGLLAIFLGAYGVHNFYLGNTGKAVAQLLITLLSCFWLSPISGIWALIEGIMILTGSIKVDGKGVALKD